MWVNEEMWVLSAAAAAAAAVSVSCTRSPESESESMSGKTGILPTDTRREVLLYLYWCIG
jgi:hypothetical protein